MPRKSTTSSSKGSKIDPAKKEEHARFQVETQTKLDKFDACIRRLLYSDKVFDVRRQKEHYKGMREIEEALLFKSDDVIAKHVKFGVITVPKEKLQHTIYGFTLTMSKQGDTEIIRMPPPSDTDIMAPDTTLADARDMVLTGVIRATYFELTGKVFRKMVERLDEADMKAKREEDIRKAFEVAASVNDLISTVETQKELNEMVLQMEMAMRMHHRS